MLLKGLELCEIFRFKAQNIMGSLFMKISEAKGVGSRGPLKKRYCPAI
jgi:hypothetical protein